MDKKEVLEKAVQKALDRGWDEVDDSVEFVDYLLRHPEAPDIESVIYNHDFAKALWGDEGFTTIGLKCDKHPGVRRYWQYQLQQMVIAKDPIKYLGENI